MDFSKTHFCFSQIFYFDELQKNEKGPIILKWLITHAASKQKKIDFYKFKFRIRKNQENLAHNWSLQIFNVFVNFSNFPLGMNFSFFPFSRFTEKKRKKMSNLLRGVQKPEKRHIDE
jgi:hypothetical protein